MAAADVTDKIGDQLGAVGRVDDLGVELRSVIAAFVIGDQREGRAIADRDNTKTGGKFGHLVAVAHPHLMSLTNFPQSVEQHAWFGDGQEGAAEFTVALTIGTAGFD